MVTECETSTSAAWRDLKFINNFFPKFESAHSLIASSYYDCSEKFAKVEFAAADWGDFEIIVSHKLLLERDNSILELIALNYLVLSV